jgi:hypothetical protein
MCVVVAVSRTTSTHFEHHLLGLVDLFTPLHQGLRLVEDALLI